MHEGELPVALRANRNIVLIVAMPLLSVAGGICSAPGLAPLIDKPVAN